VIHFVDSSVIFASVQEEHTHHRRSLAVMLAASKAQTFCSTHTIAELHATLTRIPLPLRVAPESAQLILEKLCERVSFVSLTPEEYLEAVRGLSSRRLPGAQIFDALLMACARRIEAEIIYTWNLNHFRMIAPDLAARIVEP
jgi:predicted nucleic acid-binding protein